MSDYHLRFRLLEERHHFPFTGDLELHILELPKFTKSETELLTELDTWLYFLRHAEKMDTDALPLALQRHPLVRRAMEELKMLTQTDMERERYEARRKAQLDYNTGMKVARMEGRMEEKINFIHQYERLLQRQETPAEHLESLTLEELSGLVDELQTHLQTLLLKQR